MIGSNRPAAPLVRRASDSKKFALSILITVLGTVIFSLLTEFWRHLNGGYTEAETALSFLPTLAVTAIWMGRVWERPRFDATLAVALVGALICFWTAAGEHLHLLTSAQWGLLGGLWLVGGWWLAVRR